MMRLKLSLLILLAAAISIFTFPVNAQSPAPTPQPAQGFIQSWAQEVIFPMAVRFTVSLNLLPEQVSAATLTIKPDTRESVTIPINLKNTIVGGGDTTEINYVWTVPVDSPPLLFRDISFAWLATSSSNAVGLIDGTFTFTDQRASWLKDIKIGNNLTLTLPNGEPSTGTLTPVYSRTGLDNLQTNVASVLTLLNAHLSSVPDFNILVLDSLQQPACAKNNKGESVAIGLISNTEVSCSPSVADAIYAASGYEVIPIQSITPSTIQSTLSDYIVQKSYQQAWATKDVPAWFREGLIQFYNPRPKTELNGPILNAARTNNLYPLDTMSKTAAESPNPELWNSQSYSLVLYIASQVGVNGLLTFAQSISTLPTFEEAYQSASGKSLNLLTDSLRRWLLSDAASGAFTFTPYQPPTPSPTPSRTPMPTRTPTATLTATETPTATVTGVLSATPRPTKEPTLTTTPAPATYTPRPAGSLNTPTPTPPIVANNATVANSNITLGIIILAVGAIIIMLAAIILFRPKR